MEAKHTIAVPQEALDDLHKRLALARFPDELDDAGWDYGAPLADVKRLTRFWKEQYDWRKVEAKLNELPSYHTTIYVDGFDPLDVHYIHQKNTSKDAIPLLFVHGWPGSYLEVIKLLPKLGDPSAPVKFHVVAPSLPNYAWSSGVKKRGFSIPQYAETCHKLMQKLGYSKYATQGGDWGFYITRALGLLHPESCLASHINMIRARQPSWGNHPLLALANAVTPYTDFEKEGLKRSEWFANQGSGYRVIQSTKPQTPGYGVTDSPVGLLAWIYEKLHDWTDSYAWTDEEIITWISVYWFSVAGPTASFRIYYEATHNKFPGTDEYPRDRVEQYIGTVKLGLAWSPKELTVLPKNWGRTLGDVVYEKQHERGGHLLAHEKPDEVVGDLFKMFAGDGPIPATVKELIKSG